MFYGNLLWYGVYQLQDLWVKNFFRLCISDIMLILWFIVIVSVVFRWLFVLLMFLNFIGRLRCVLVRKLVFVLFGCQVLNFRLLCILFVQFLRILCVVVLNGNFQRFGFFMWFEKFISLVFVFLFFEMFWYYFMLLVRIVGMLYNVLMLFIQVGLFYMLEVVGKGGLECGFVWWFLRELISVVFLLQM